MCQPGPYLLIELIRPRTEVTLFLALRTRDGFSHVCTHFGVFIAAQKWINSGSNNSYIAGRFCESNHYNNAVYVLMPKLQLRL